ncbi:MAG TPA: bifunctional UDP-N-acetylglucosamine diphosphorylase/glucosamine-1-phosphate N-acetyltransferase GlmU [Actinomycetota bacterium]|nr:bifunctional UDP-N-acetylglucosamine diphosphorylase/glucosamine-1-phosphate N-acetyltransferase GlmU [Actinomycetota bacterium]
MAARKTPRTLAAVVLAAGRGKRMKSARPKVLHDVCGRPSLWHVLKAALEARPRTLVVVVRERGDEVEEAVTKWGLKPEPTFVYQGTPLGTGHAVGAAENAVGDFEDVLVLSGDDPLIGGEQVRSLLGVHRRSKASATILTTMLDDPAGFGRVIRRGGELVEIVQEVDASPEQLEIKEVSTLVYVFRREDLFRALPLVGRENKQSEYYLPDVISILKDKGEKVGVLAVDLGGGLGLNSRGGLAEVSRIMRRRIIQRHMESGVTFVDPATAYVDVDVTIGRDTLILPFTFLQGSTRVGARCRIGPGTQIVDSMIEEDAEVAFSVVRGARIGPRVMVGPYASIRPGTEIAEGGKAGTFVEMKATRVGKRSKVPHLAYMGDATIGEDVNVGAGTITCNYDGFEKHPTVIEDDAFIGSDTMLVAPVKVGKGAVTGAGSAITKDVPPGALAVERAEQRVVPDYAKRRTRESTGTDDGEKGTRRGGRKRGK